MARFLEKYVQDPLQDLLGEEPVKLPDLLLSMGSKRLTVRVGENGFSIVRDAQAGNYEKPQLPDDVDEEVGA